MTKIKTIHYRSELNYVIVVYGVLFLLCMGCTKQPSADLPKHIKNLNNLTVYSSDQHPDTVLLEHRQAIGNNDKAPIGHLADLAVDSTGRVFLADAKQQNIKVYNADGRYIKQLGRRGKGPGEFTNITDLQTNGRKLFARDNNQQKVVIFSIDSLLVEQTIKLASNRNEYRAIRGANLGSYIIDNNDGFFMGFTKHSYPNGKGKWKRVIHVSYYYFLDNKGKINFKKVLKDTSFVSVFVPLPNYTVDRSTGLFGKSHITLSKNNHIYAVPDRSAHFFIKVYSYAGVYQRGFYYPYKNVPLTYKSASEAGIAQYILRGFHSMKLPQTWPAVYEMKIDEQNRLWVATIINNQKVYEWWVLNNRCKLLARFNWPRDKPIQQVRNGYLYAIETTAKGLNQVVKYKIHFEKN